MFFFCKYKDMFGKPNTGLHKHRILDIALIDFISTILLGKFIQYFFFPDKNIYFILFFCFLAGIIFHRIFCVRTTVDKLLF
jgi:hypothetical protein